MSRWWRQRKSALSSSSGSATQAFDVGCGNAGTAADQQEALFELAGSEAAAGVVLGEHFAQQLGAGPAVRASEDVIDGAHVEDAQLLGAVQRAFEATPVDDFGEVEEGAGEAGAGDGVDGGAVAWQEGMALVGDDAAPPAARTSAGGHVDDASVVWSHTVQRGG